MQNVAVVYHNGSASSASYTVTTPLSVKINDFAGACENKDRVLPFPASLGPILVAMVQ